MNNPTRNIKNYKQLNIFEREKITLYLIEQKSITEIAKILNRSKSTISREVQRNKNNKSIDFVYSAIKAEQKSRKRKRKACKKDRLKNKKIRTLVEELIFIGHSPKTIVSILKNKYNLKTNHESIYMWIYKTRNDLTDFLCQKNRKRKKRYLKRKSRIHIPNRVDISQRPKEANERSEFGHFETDLIVCSQSKSCILTIIERKSRYAMMKLLSNKKSETVHNALVSELKKFPANFCKTITYDNGSENALHEKTNQILNTKSYFCKPYHSWEKGSVENLNKLIRRFIPKKTDISLIKNADIYNIKNMLNIIPRKANQFLSAQKVMSVALLD